MAFGVIGQVGDGRLQAMETSLFPPLCLSIPLSLSGRKDYSITNHGLNKLTCTKDTAADYSAFAVFFSIPINYLIRTDYDYYVHTSQSERRDDHHWILLPMWNGNGVKEWVKGVRKRGYYCPAQVWGAHLHLDSFFFLFI